MRAAPLAIVIANDKDVSHRRFTKQEQQNIALAVSFRAITTHRLSLLSHTVITIKHHSGLLSHSHPKAFTSFALLLTTSLLARQQSHRYIENRLVHPSYRLSQLRDGFQTTSIR